MAADKPTPKQLQFCKEYIIDLNATQAAIRAGYSKKTARQKAHNLFTIVYILEKVEELQSERSKRTEITSDMVLKELAKIAFFDPRGLFNKDWTMKQPQDWSDDVAAVIGGIDVNHIVGNDDLKAIVSKLKVVSKEKALELIGRHLAMFTDKIVKVDKSELVEI